MVEVDFLRKTTLGPTGTHRGLVHKANIFILRSYIAMTERESVTKCPPKGR